MSKQHRRTAEDRISDRKMRATMESARRAIDERRTHHRTLVEARPIGWRIFSPVLGRTWWRLTKTAALRKAAAVAR